MRPWEPPLNGLDAAATEQVRQVLATSALLEDDAFYIAERILKRFVASRPTQPEDIIRPMG